ncbi:TPA: DUF2977 domain-containing protein [Staphylococcus aureus]|nr:DUF2977 domain-containing protein [Staphylococcus aureus]
MMQLLINERGEIISYAITGGFDGGVTVERLPDDFEVMYKPRLYVYANGEVVRNKEYPTEESDNNQSPVPNVLTVDNKVMHILANMQKQVTQLSKVSLQTSKQNAMMAQQIVKLNKELEERKGDVENA